MKNLESLKIQVFNKDKKWVNIYYKDIKSGMTLRLYEQNGDAIKGKRGTIFISTTDAFQTEKGVYTFKYKEPENV